MIVEQIQTKDDVTRNKYLCDWCGHEWLFNVRTFEKVTDQVVCPKCKRFIKSLE